jgi:hypothetical protein
VIKFKSYSCSCSWQRSCPWHCHNVSSTISSTSVPST